MNIFEYLSPHHITVFSLGTILWTVTWRTPTQVSDTDTERTKHRAWPWSGLLIIFQRSKSSMVLNIILDCSVIEHGIRILICQEEGQVRLCALVRPSLGLVRPSLGGSDVSDTKKIDFLYHHPLAYWLHIYPCFLVKSDNCLDIYHSYKK